MTCTTITTRLAGRYNGVQGLDTAGRREFKQVISSWFVLVTVWFHLVQPDWSSQKEVSQYFGKICNSAGFSQICTRFVGIKMCV